MFSLPLLPLLFLILLSDMLHATDLDINRVRQNCIQSANASWEFGTLYQAELSLIGSPFSLFASSSLPFGKALPDSSPLTAVFEQLDQNVFASLNDSSGPQPFFPDDGAAGDPPSVGVAAILASLYKPSGPYARAIKNQLDFLYSPDRKRTNDGAWSHRVEKLQLWSDNVAMVPPFLAYLGAIENNITRLRDAYTQVQLYHTYLSDASTKLWRHIVLGGQGDDDPNPWATGNGWAVIGMLRVLSIMKRSNKSSQLTKEVHDLTQWTTDALRGVYTSKGFNQTTGILTNYLGIPNTPRNYPDAASTALLAACAYRLASLTGKTDFLSAAELTWATLTSPGGGTGQLKYFPDWWLSPVVDPYDWGRQSPPQGVKSPEAQAFVMELYSARMDWLSAHPSSSPASDAGADLGLCLGAVITSVALAIGTTVVFRTAEQYLLF